MIDHWTCRAERPIQHADLLSLTHLYQPLVGPKAIALYFTLSNQLCAQAKDQLQLQSIDRLLGLLSFTEEELIKARYLLEGIGLLNSYKIVDQQDRNYIEFELIPPLAPKKFFQSDVLCMALYHQIGKEEFLAIREELLPASGRTIAKQRIDITKSYQEVFDSISPKEMAQYAKLEKEELWSDLEIDESKNEGKYPKWNEHNLAAVRLQLGSWIKEEDWTKELEEELSEIQYLYQLDDWGLLKALQNPEVIRQGKIDVARLKQFVREEYQHRFGLGKSRVAHQSNDNEKQEPLDHEPLTEEEKHFQQLAQISPIELLSFYQGGGKIPDSDLELVESLVHDYGLPSGVINVLLEYVLLKYNYKLPKALVEKIAGHWKRLRIQTVQEALAQAKKEDWEVRKKSQSKGKKRTKKPSQPIPQAVAEQMNQDEHEDYQAMNQQDWLETQARINEKIALWERRKKRV